MKAFCLLLLLLPILPSASGQRKADALNYYRTINAAEMAVAKRNLPAAYNLYQKAFKINPDKPFSRDLLNAYYCSLDLHHYTKAAFYLQVLLARGMDAWSINEFIRKQAKRPELDSIDKWLALYPNDTLRTGPIDQELRAMHAKDQATRAYFNHLKDGKYMVDSVFEMDNQHGTRLAQLFAEKGVLNEGQVGHLNNNPIAGPSYSILASHYACGYSGKKYCHALDTMLFKAIYTYDFAPQEFVNIYNSSETNVNGVPFSYRKDTLHLPLTVNFICIYGEDKLYPEYFPPAQEARMNKERAMLGMPSLNELRTKAAFRQKANADKDVYAKYQIVGSIAVMEGESYEEAKPYIEKAQRYKPR